MTTYMEKTIIKPFSGLANFRDLGGKTTRDGRRIKTGLLFRSDALHKLTQEDLHTFARHGIRTVCDLRTPRERKRKPNRIPLDPAIAQHHFPIYPDPNFREYQLFAYLFGHAGGERYQAYIAEFYQRIAFVHADVHGKVISLLSEEAHVPALFHCSAGRDRTGFVAALVQLLLGVPRETVIKEYLLTNDYVADAMQQFIKKLGWLRVFGVTEQRMQQIMLVKAAYLEAVLDQIDQQYGSIDGYALQACGLSDQCLAKLRALLLV